MEAKDRIFDEQSFDGQSVECPKCGWKGVGAGTIVADFYGLGKFKQVSCPKCQEYLGNLSNDSSIARGGKTSKS